MAEQKVEIVLERTKMTRGGLGRFQGEQGERGDADYVGVTIYLGTGFTPAVLAEAKVVVVVP